MPTIDFRNATDEYVSEVIKDWSNKPEVNEIDRQTRYKWIVGDIIKQSILVIHVTMNEVHIDLHQSAIEIGDIIKIAEVEIINENGSRFIFNRIQAEANHYENEEDIWISLIFKKV